MKRQRHSISRTDVWRTGAATCGLMALLAIPSVGYCSGPDLAAPEGLIAYAAQIGTYSTIEIAQSNATAIQYGGTNGSHITQPGTSNQAIAMQYGYGNKAGVAQTGTNHFKWVSS